MYTYFYVPGRYVAGVYFDFFEHAEPVELENQVQLIADGIVRPADPSFACKIIFNRCTYFIVFILLTDASSKHIKGPVKNVIKVQKKYKFVYIHVCAFRYISMRYTDHDRNNDCSSHKGRK